MGVHVILDIDPLGIDEAAWVTVYEETLRNAWTRSGTSRCWT